MGTKFAHKKLETLGYHTVETRSLYLTGPQLVPGRDGQTERITTANKHLAVPAAARKNRIFLQQPSWNDMVITALVCNDLDRHSCSTPSPVSTGMGDHQQVGKPALYATSHRGQLNCPPGKKSISIVDYRDCTMLSLFQNKTLTYRNKITDLDDTMDNNGQFDSTKWQANNQR